MSNDQIKLELIRELSRARMLEVPPFSGEEMTLPNDDPRHEGFVNGERTLAAQILAILDGHPDAAPELYRSFAH